MAYGSYMGKHSRYYYMTAVVAVAMTFVVAGVTDDDLVPISIGTSVIGKH
jgi:hypothetical protein